MDATRFCLALSLLAAPAGSPALADAPAPLVADSAARPLGAPQPTPAGEPPRGLALPALVQPPAVASVHDAFDLSRPLGSPGPLPPVRDDKLRQASTNPTSPLAQHLLSLYAEAERVAGRGRSVGELTDLIERCELNADQAGLADDPAVRRLASWAYNRRGELRADAQDPREAFADFQHAIVLDPGNAAALANRGVTLAQHGKAEEALADFAQAIARDPNQPLPYRNRAELLSQTGEHERAVEDYDRALALTPNDASALAGRGYCQSRLGRFAHAVRDYNQAISLRPADAETLTLRGAAFAEVGYYEQAIADFNAALAADPESAAAYQSVAWLLSTCPDERFRDPDKGLEAALRAQRFGRQGDPWLLDVLAAAHANAGRFEHAVRVQQQAAVLAPRAAQPELHARLDQYRKSKPYRQPPVQTALAPAAGQQALR